MLTNAQAETHLNSALAAISEGSDWRAILDRLPVPIYTVDAHGAVTYWSGKRTDEQVMQLAINR